MTDRALLLEKEDQTAAVDMLVAIVAAGRSHLGDGHAAKIHARLSALYDLGSIDTLRK